MTASVLMQMMSMVHLVHIMVRRCTGNKHTCFKLSKIDIGHSTDLVLIMVVICSLVMIVGRSVIEEAFIGMVGETEVQKLVL